MKFNSMCADNSRIGYIVCPHCDHTTDSAVDEIEGDSEMFTCDSCDQPFKAYKTSFEKTEDDRESEIEDLKEQIRYLQRRLDKVEKELGI